LEKREVASPCLGKGSEKKDHGWEKGKPSKNSPKLFSTSKHGGVGLRKRGGGGMQEKE